MHNFSDSLVRHGGFAHELELYRMWHLHLCEAVTNTDNMFSALTFIAYLTNIPLTMFLLYEVLFLKLVSWTVIILYCYWIFTNTAIIALISWFSAEVNDKVRKNTQCYLKR